MRLSARSWVTGFLLSKINDKKQNHGSYSDYVNKFQQLIKWFKLTAFNSQWRTQIEMVTQI